MNGNSSYDIYVQIEGLEQIREKVIQINKLLTEVEELARSIRKSSVYLKMDPKENYHDIGEGNG